MFILTKGTDGPNFIKEELYNTATGYVVLGSTVLVLISSLISFGYIWYYLKLNVFLKTILYQMSVLGIIGSAITILAEAIILITKEQTLTTCSIMHYSAFIVVSSDVLMTAMISALRYIHS
jgi:hypothetical protein